jgi:hypothetical protein
MGVAGSARGVGRRVVGMRGEGEGGWCDAAGSVLIAGDVAGEGDGGGVGSWLGVLEPESKQ